jgi:hypothetical protein
VGSSPSAGSIKKPFRFVEAVFVCMNLGREVYPELVSGSPSAGSIKKPFRLVEAVFYL